MARIRWFIIAVALMMNVSPANAVSSDKGRVFLSFDDGPINASLKVLDALSAEDVKATYFINTVHLQGQGGEREDRAPEALRRMVAEGHVIGNHSSDHMAHNRPPGVYAMAAAQAYRDVETDVLHFVPENITLVNESLGSLASRANNQIAKIARLPFSNVWMLPAFDGVCRWCGVRQGPFWHIATMANAEREVSEAGGQTAAALYSRYKMTTFGWDVHWQPSGWTLPTANETLPPAPEIEREIVSLLEEDRYCTPTLSGASCKYPLRRKNVIVLMHDFLFENGVRGRGEDVNIPQLIGLIRSLKAKGYIFETLDHYLD